jgi:hypothetical protein
MISESEPSVDEPVLEESEESLLEISSTPLLQPSYHLGLVVSSGDRPLTYPLETLLSDPPLHQNALPSHMETPGDNVVLDEHTSELENTYYLMELNNEYLNVDVEADQWFSSMDVDAGVDSTTRSLAVDGDEPPSNPPGPRPSPPPPTASGSGPSSSSSSHPPQQTPNDSASCPPQPQTQPDSSPETTVVNVKSGEETDGGKSETDTSKSSRELNRFALLISV